MSSNALVNGTVYKVGKDGITPTIGDNENWYLGDADTGKPSRGKEGPRGPAGNAEDLSGDSRGGGVGLVDEAAGGELCGGKLDGDGPSDHPDTGAE